MFGGRRLQVSLKTCQQEAKDWTTELFIGFSEMAVMNAKKTGLIALVVLAVAVDLGSALKCWSCTSTSDKACHDPFNRSQLSITDCDHNRSQSSYSSYARAVCKKMKQRVSGGDLITIRQCDWVAEHSSDNRDTTHSNACASTSAPSYVKVEYCETCSQDGCNGSMSHIAASAWSAFIPVIVYFGYMKTL